MDIADRRGDLRYGLPLSLGITQDSWISDLRNFTKIFEQPTRYELVVYLKTANTLGLTAPHDPRPCR